jgi:hypothetical protein
MERQAPSQPPPPVGRYEPPPGAIGPDGLTMTQEQDVTDAVHTLRLLLRRWKLLAALLGGLATLAGTRYLDRWAPGAAEVQAIRDAQQDSALARHTRDEARTARVVLRILEAQSRYACRKDRDGAQDAGFPCKRVVDEGEPLIPDP